jgi:hypothetical protein
MDPNVERYLRPDQEIGVEAPRCVRREGALILEQYIPVLTSVNWLKLARSFTYLERVLITGGKFVFHCYPRKAVVSCRARRVREAGDEGRKQRGVKGKWRDEGCENGRCLLIFRAPLDC